MDRQNNTGVLFVNNKENERQPDYTGNIVVNGKDYRLAAWKRTSQNGREYLSVAVSEPQPSNGTNDLPC